MILDHEMPWEWMKRLSPRVAHKLNNLIKRAYNLTEAE